MKLNIRHKLFITLLATSTIVASSLFFFLQWSFDKGFLDYVKRQEVEQLESLSKQLASYYAQNDDWGFIAQNDRLWQNIHYQVLSSDDEPPFGEPVGDRDMKIGPPPMGTRNIGPRILLYGADKEWIIGGPRDISPWKSLPLHAIKKSGVVIGYLALIPVRKISHSADLRFVEQQTTTFAGVTLIMLGMSVLLTFPLTTHLLRPIQQLTKGTRKLIGGQFKTRIAVTTKDELGVLSDHFNILAMTLEENEKSRKKWVADISHELRTPLAILQGEIEALQDGIRKPDTKTLSSLHGEVLHLERLVGDLYELSMSDIGALTYKKVVVDPVNILSWTLECFEQRFKAKGVELDQKLTENSGNCILGDPDRLQQLFTNLLENSLRYTSAPGTLSVYTEEEMDKTIIIFEDSAPGVEEFQLPRLFERLYRTDPSRKRNGGGAGLGLSICKNIVEAHRGTITSHASLRGGLKIRIEFPRSA